MWHKRKPLRTPKWLCFRPIWHTCAGGQYLHDIKILRTTMEVNTINLEFPLLLLAAWPIKSRPWQWTSRKWWMTTSTWWVSLKSVLEGRNQTHGNPSWNWTNPIEPEMDKGDAHEKQRERAISRANIKDYWRSNTLLPNQVDFFRHTQKYIP